MQKPESENASSKEGRDAEHRRSYYGRPLDYFEEILGIKNLSRDQRDLINKIERNNAVAAKAANAVGKSFIVSAYGVYWMDVVGSRLDADGYEMGALVLITAPNAQLIFSVLFGAFLGHIRNAAKRGFMMPGEYSELSVKWRVREDWQVEQISPAKASGQAQQHGASGRHHDQLLYLMDEAAGVERPRYRAMDGVVSGLGNKKILTANPTEGVGAFADACKSAEYVVTRISALTHPNVVHRREIIPGGAVSHVKTDARVKNWCVDRGPYTPGKIEPDPKWFDFLYALHPWVGDNDRSADIPEPSPRSDGIPGHADAEIHVFRPNSAFLPTVLGEFPTSDTAGLFPIGHLTGAQERWLEYAAKYGDPIDPYASVGIDPAEEGGDEPMSCPAWKLPAGNWRIDRLQALMRGKDHIVAGSAYVKYGHKPLYVVDAIGVGAGTANRLEIDHQCRVTWFKGSEGEYSLEDEPEFFNLRAAAYWRAAMLVQSGKVDLPPDSQLIEELQATKYEFRQGRLKIIDKKKIRDDVLGRSPDRADAFVNALHREMHESSAGSGAVAQGGRAPNEGPPTDYSYYEEAA